MQLETLLPAPLLLQAYQFGGNARLDVLDSILNLISFSAILWSTSQTLTGALAIYATWWKGCTPSLFLNGLIFLQRALLSDGATEETLKARASKVAGSCRSCFVSPEFGSLLP